jgi:hypothetical protein
MQTNPNRAPLFVRRRLRRYTRVPLYQGCHYIKGAAISGVGAISRVALYQGWRYIKGGDISRVALYQGWLYIEGGAISMVAIY